MFDLIAPFFQEVYDKTGINYNIFYDRYEYDRFLSGAAISLQLMLGAISLSLIIGVLGAWAQGSRSRILRGAINAYIQAFRNTPPMIQLLFFYFGLGALTPKVDMGGYSEPAISAFALALIALGLFGGAYNVEIFRSGIEAVPRNTLEAAESLCLSKRQTFQYVTLPLAFRICLPALTNNLISLVKTTSLAYVISVPEMTYILNQIWSDNINVPEMMLILFAFYVGVVSVLSAGLNFLERRLALPGFRR